MKEEVRTGDWLGGNRRQCENCGNYVLEEYLTDESCPACRT